MFLSLLMIVFSFSTITAYAADTNENKLPEYESQLNDYSNSDPQYSITNNASFVNKQSFVSNYPKIDNDNKKSTPKLNSKASYQNVYTKDAYEDNNSKGNASNLGTFVSDYALGVSTGGTIHDTGPDYLTNRDDRDIDYYEFTTQEPYVYQIRLSNIPANCDYDIKLYVKTKTFIFFNKYTQVAYSAFGGTSNELMDSYNNNETGESYDYLPEGKYVVEIYSFKGCSSNSYSLSFSFRGLDDDYEINDTKNSAYQYSLPNSETYNTSLQGTIDRNDDVDWFLISPQSYNSRISITLRSPASNYKYRMELYNGNNFVSSNFSSDVIEDKYTNLQLIYGNTYYIKIYSPNNSTHSTKFKYTLSFSGTNSNTTYNYKDNNGNWNQYGMIWTYDQEASTNNGYTAKKYYSYNESYLYMTEKIYLYNFNAVDIGRAIGAYDKLIELLDERPNFLQTIGEDIWISVGTGAFDYIMKKKVDFNPNTFYIKLGYTVYKFVAQETLSQYQLNLYNYMSSKLNDVTQDTNHYRIEIEIYSRAGSTDKYIYVRFINNNDLYVPDFFPDTIYTNEIVYGNITYLNSTLNSDYVNNYLFNSNHNYKNNFPF